MAALRAAVSPDWVARTAIPLREAFGSSYLQGRVVRLDPAERIVSLEDGQNISFSHCVISVGSLGPNPARKPSPTKLFFVYFKATDTTFIERDHVSLHIEHLGEA